VLSYGGEAELIPAEHREFMAHCLRYYETETHLFVHANYLPNLPLPDQPPAALFWEHITRRMPSPHMSGKTAVVGHTPQHNGQVFDAGHLLAIDTYVFGEGMLTALEVHTGELWQATKYGYVRESKLWK
jgi:serine/threonine protein phosphatase 1